MHLDTDTTPQSATDDATEQASVAEQADTQALRLKPYLRVKEVALIFGVSERTVANLIAAGELKSSRIHGNRRVSQEQLREYEEKAAADERPTLGARHQETVRRPRKKDKAAAATA